ncbi:hypothetical protein RHSIM_Rhsim01G0030400 [Rhododendron simsii]|uniref:F-box domain-containing protein n=1 Tax=Rhododendron simsii TaxID=118357 RepID=A0A834LXK6_RHOSS|nr:hypothetical protein RHSIM_Rhsim01G0030400 [Rhododendron simsii]
MKKQGHGHFPDDCWELIFQKLREDDERDLDSISLVSKRFLSISNRVKLILKVKGDTLPVLQNLLQRFPHIKSIVINTYAQKDTDGLLDKIAEFGVLNLEAIKFDGWTEPPRDGFTALAFNNNVKKTLKVLDCSGLIYIQDNDLVSIGDCFPRLEELRISAHNSTAYVKAAAGISCITDDGVDALASKLKELKQIAFTGDACFITDKSLISLSTKCIKLRKINLDLWGISQHHVTGDGIGFVMRHSHNLTCLSLQLWSSDSSQHSAFFFPMENAFTDAKNLYSLTMSRDLISDKHICLLAKARPPLKKLKLIVIKDQYYSEIHGGLKMLLQACQLTLEKLTLRGWPLTETSMDDLAEYLSNLTYINLNFSIGLTSITIYTLTKSCPLLETLKMAHTRGQEVDNFSPNYLQEHYRMRHLDISGNNWLTDMTLQNIGQVCPNLQFLDVSHCLHLPYFGIGEVLRRCSAITQLHIDCLEVSDVFGCRSDYSVENLKTLKAHVTRLNDERMAMIGNKCRNLQYLHIGFYEEVTDKGVMEVVRNCERLREITLIGCKEVSEQLINRALSFGCRLRKLS